MKTLLALVACAALCSGCMSVSKVKTFIQSLPANNFSEASETITIGPFGGEEFTVTNAMADGKGNVTFGSAKGSLNVLKVYTVEAHVTGFITMPPTPPANATSGPKVDATTP